MRSAYVIALVVFAWAAPSDAKKPPPKKTTKAAKAKPTKGKPAKPTPSAATPAAKPELIAPPPAAPPLQPVNEPPSSLTPSPAPAAPAPESSLPPRSRPAPVSEAAAAPPPPEHKEEAKEDKNDIGLVIGLSGGIVGGLSKPLGLAPQGALELGYRLPFLNRMLGLSLEPTFLAFLASTVSGVKTEGIGISIPLLVTLNFHAGPGLVRVLAGPTIAYMQVKTTDTLGTSTDTTWVFGLHASAGYWFELPVGAIFAAVDFKVLPYAALAQNKMYLGLGGRLGYAFLF